MGSPRSFTERDDQDGKAAFEAATASFTSWTVASGTEATGCLFVGLMTVKVLQSEALRNSLWMKRCVSIVAWVPSVWAMLRGGLREGASPYCSSVLGLQYDFCSGESPPVEMQVHVNPLLIHRNFESIPDDGLVANEVCHADPGDCILLQEVDHPVSSPLGRTGVRRLLPPSHDEFDRQQSDYVLAGRLWPLAELSATQ
jgi:hypothetical protein